MAKTWEGLAPMLRWINTRITPKNVSDVFGTNYHLPVYITDLWKANSDSSVDLSGIRNMQLLAHLQFSESNTDATKQSVSDKQFLLQALEWISTKLRELAGSGAALAEEGEALFDSENVCAVVAFTLVRDGWFENRRCTKTRNPNVSRGYVVWTLLLAFRYKRRASTFSENLRFKGIHFKNHVKITTDSDNLPVLEWEPWRVYRTMIDLDTKYIRERTAYDKEESEAMNLLRDLLLDRCAMLAFCPVRGSGEALFHNHVLWFKETDTAAAEARQEAREENKHGTRLADFIDVDIMNRLEAEKKHKDASFADGAIYDPASDKKNEENAKQVQSAHEHIGDYSRDIESYELQNMKSTLKKLQELSAKYEKLASEAGGVDLLPLHIIEARERNHRNIHRVAAFVSESEKLRVSAATSAETERLHRLREEAIESIIGGANAGGEAQNAGAATFCAQTPWFLDTFYVGLSFYKWQALEVDFDAITTHTHTALKQRLLREALDGIKLLGATSLQERVKKWIFRVESSNLRRELYRQRVNYKPSFDDFSVWRQLYASPAAETSLFPVSAKDYLNASHAFHYAALSCIGYEFVAQQFPLVEIDTAFFYWDLDDEFMSLERTEIKHPVMTCIGSTWCVYAPPLDPLLDPDPWSFPETGNIRVRAFGRDFFDCLAQYCILLKEQNWITGQRTGNKELDLGSSFIASVTNAITNTTAAA